MKPISHYRGIAHIWLFSANVDPADLDTQGNTRVQSLAMLLHSTEREGRRAATEQYSTVHKSGELDLNTGSYNVAELQELLKKAASETG